MGKKSKYLPRSVKVNVTEFEELNTNVLTKLLKKTKETIPYFFQKGPANKDRAGGDHNSACESMLEEYTRVHGYLIH